MKAVRVKLFNSVSSLIQYKIILVRDIFQFRIMFSSDSNVAVITFRLNKKELFSLDKLANLEEFNNFKQSWENFKKNEAYFFDLSNWEIK